MADRDDGELAGFRQAKDAFFRDGHDSPLTADQQRAFADLPYFNENPSLRGRGRAGGADRLPRR